MIMVIYDLSEDKFFQLHEPDCTPDDVREFVLRMRFQSMQDKASLRGLFYIAFDLKEFFSVFTLDERDEKKLTQKLLESLRKRAYELVQEPLPE